MPESVTIHLNPDQTNDPASPAHPTSRQLEARIKDLEAGLTDLSADLDHTNIGCDSQEKRLVQVMNDLRTLRQEFDIYFAPSTRNKALRLARGN